MEQTLKTYLALTKPGIIMGNMITAFAGFACASQGHMDSALLIAMSLGIAFMIGSGCVLNNYLDRTSDQKMDRTKKRSLATGAIDPKEALIFGAALAVCSLLTLAFFTNLLTSACALFGFAIYVFVYSPLKYKTKHATLIGAVSGAMPPLVGYAAVTGKLDLSTALFFALILTWQMPHFFAIAIYRMKDYAKANIPVWPLAKGIVSTKRQMIWYLLIFMLTAFSMTAFGILNIYFAILAAGLGMFWLVFAISGLRARDDYRWARQMFMLSLIVVSALSFAIPLTVIK